MALTIPNESAAAADSQQATLYQTDLDTLVAGIGGDTGVVYGCAVTAQGTPDNTVAVAAGVVRAAGALVVVAAGNVTMPTADGSNPMWVLISSSNAGVKTATAGTAAASPLLPAIPSGHVPLAAVWWPASDTTVSTGQITDKRVLLPPLMPGTPPLITISTTLYPVMPGVEGQNRTDKQYQGNFVYYEPRLVRRRITIDRLGCEIESAAASGTGRMGIYRATSTWQPGALIVDGGTFAINTTGVKTTTVSVSLDPGYYLAAITVGGNINLRCVRGGNELIGYPGDTSVFGGGMFWLELKVSKTYAALADPGTAWDDQRCTFDEGFNHALWWRPVSYG